MNGECLRSRFIVVAENELKLRYSLQLWRLIKMELNYFNILNISVVWFSKRHNLQHHKLLNGVVRNYQSNYECAMNCIKRTKYSKKNSNFNCTNARTKNSKNLNANNESIDYFINECEMNEELLVDMVGYYKYWRLFWPFNKASRSKYHT